MLTVKQHELLSFIHDRLAATGVSPSFDEMREALELKSKSGRDLSPLHLQLALPLHERLLLLLKTFYLVAEAEGL